MTGGIRNSKLQVAYERLQLVAPGMGRPPKPVSGMASEPWLDSFGQDSWWKVSSFRVEKSCVKSGGKEQISGSSAAQGQWHRSEASGLSWLAIIS